MTSLFSNGGSISVFIDKDKKKHYSVRKPASKFDRDKISSKYLTWTNHGDFTYSLKLAAPDLSFAFDMESKKDPLLVGENGLIPMGKTGYSYYYSLTDADMKGTLVFENRTFTLKGKGWIDHQWGTWSYGRDFDSWEWFSIQLGDGTDIMIGKIMLADQTLDSGMNILTKDNETSFISNIDIEYLDNWLDDNGLTWSRKWRVTSITQEYDIKLTASLDFDDQFVSDTVFEGSGTVKGTINGKEVEGLMFFEKLYFGQKKMKRRKMSSPSVD
jgi:predicted secreted hydrolase